MLGAISSVGSVTHIRRPASSNAGIAGTGTIAGIAKQSAGSATSLLDLSPETLSLLQSSTPTSIRAPTRNYITSYYSSINLT